MATVTPTYSWPVPTSTDYVADGAVAIEALGDAIDSTVATALGGAYPGLRLIKKQTVGTGIATVTVTDAFSATYDSYKIIYTGYVNSGVGGAIYLRLGGNTTNYQTNLISINNSGGVTAQPGIGNFITVGVTSTSVGQIDVDVHRPFQALPCNVQTRSYRQFDIFMGGGTDANSVSRTSFNLTAQSSQTFTGGTVYVYGYGAS
jgi:hypothetical protein